MFGRTSNKPESPIFTRWEDMPVVDHPGPAMPSNEKLPEIPADSTWEFRTHRGHIHTFTGTRLDGDHSQYMIVKVNFNYWSKGYPGGDWCVKENLEIIGAVSKGSVEMWRKVTEGAMESTPQAV